jgi:ankyrin repeat protein
MSFINNLSTITETHNDVFHDTLKKYNDRVKKFLRDKRNFSLNSTSTNDINKYTLLHIATITENYELISILIDYGADIDQKDSFGKSSFDLAINCNNKKIIDIFLNSILNSKDKEISTLKQDNVFYSNRFRDTDLKVKTLEKANKQLEQENQRLSISYKREKRKYLILENTHTQHMKRKRTLETKCNDLESKNKKLKTVVENLSNSLKQ